MCMFDDVEKITRLTFAASRVFSRQVVVIERTAWVKSVNEDGSPTLMTELPKPLKSVAENVFVVLTAGSGINNPDPGVDVVRLDEADAPDIYNIDHYRVIEDMTTDESFQQINETAGLQSSKELDGFVQDYVFFVKNRAIETPDHRSGEFPHRINISQLKNTQTPNE